MDDTVGAPVRDTFSGKWTATPLTVVICSALAGYNALECLILVFATFKRYHGLYFWSLVVATTGILVYMPGVTLWYFALTEKWVALIFVNLGWYAMVTGQSVILYSRLGVVLGHEHERLRQAVKWMIIIDAILFHGITTIVSICSIYARNPAPFTKAYFYVEKIQMTGFSVQELIISGLYIWKTLDILRAGSNVQTHARRTMAELLMINLVIVFIDIALLTLEYRNLFFHELSFKMMAYAVKAKLEFAILSKLVKASQTGVVQTATSLPHDLVTHGALTDNKATRTASAEHEKSKTEMREEIEASTRYTYAIAPIRSPGNRKDSEMDYAEIMRTISKG